MTDSTTATAACRCPDCGSLDVSSLGGGVDRCASCGTTWPHATATGAAGEPFDVNVRKVSHMIHVSREMAMDYGLIPDDRPAPPPPTLRQRFRWWRQERLRRARMQLASWIAGFDVEDSW